MVCKGHISRKECQISSKERLFINGNNPWYGSIRVKGSKCTLNREVDVRVPYSIIIICFNSLLNFSLIVLLTLIRQTIVPVSWSSVFFIVIYIFVWE